MAWFRYFLILYVHVWNWFGTRTDHQEICGGKEFTVKCSSTEVILMQSAIFGRMRIGKCVKKDLGYLGCQNDVLALTDKWCSGQQQCSTWVTNDELDKANTACISDVNSYLEVEYSCVPVIQPGSICASNSPVNIHTSEGYISSHVTSQTGCGSSKAPWVIEAQPGQTVHLWLIDFGALDRQRQSLYTSCQQLYGFIIERDLGVNLTMCGGTERKTEIYKSKTNKVEIHLLAKKTGQDSKYLVQFTLKGCPDLTPPAHAWYKRDGEEAVIGCKSNDRVWRLYCNGNSWNGVVGNCSKADMSEKESLAGIHLPFSSVIFLTCVICGALLIVIVVIVAGSVYVKKQSIKHEIKLRSDYGIVGQSMYYTMKPAYEVASTLRNKQGQPAVDSQPLVNIVEKQAIDPTRSTNECSHANLL